MKRITQYESILSALRRAGRKGCTIRELQEYSNWPHKRIAEMIAAFYAKPLTEYYADQVTESECILFDEKLVNGRKLRVYRLEKIK